MFQILLPVSNNFYFSCRMRRPRRAGAVSNAHLKAVGKEQAELILGSANVLPMNISRQIPAVMRQAVRQQGGAARGICWRRNRSSDREYR